MAPRIRLRKERFITNFDARTLGAIAPCTFTSPGRFRSVPSMRRFRGVAPLRHKPVYEHSQSTDDSRVIDERLQSKCRRRKCVPCAPSGATLPIEHQRWCRIGFVDDRGGVIHSATSAQKREWTRNFCVRRHMSDYDLLLEMAAVPLFLLAVAAVAAYFLRRSVERSMKINFLSGTTIEVEELFAVPNTCQHPRLSFRRLNLSTATVPTENSISVRKVKQSSCGKRIPRLPGRRWLLLPPKRQCVTFSA